MPTRSCRTTGMGRALCFVASVIAFTSTSVSAQVNSWIKPGSGDWQDQTAWSLSTLPGPGQVIMLTNQGWKAIAIGSATASSFTQSLNVDSVIVSGYTDSFNVLMLYFAGSDV